MQLLTLQQCFYGQIKYYRQIKVFAVFLDFYNIKALTVPDFIYLILLLFLMWYNFKDIQLTFWFRSGPGFSSGPPLCTSSEVVCSAKKDTKQQQKRHSSGRQTY